MTLSMMILYTGIMIGSRKYEFLGSSNAQLRHGCYLYAKDDNGNQANDIRKSLGNLQKIKCVASYMSRLGLGFSETNILKRVERRFVRYELILNSLSKA